MKKNIKKDIFTNPKKILLNFSAIYTPGSVSESGSSNSNYCGSGSESWCRQCTHGAANCPHTFGYLLHTYLDIKLFPVVNVKISFLDNVSELFVYDIGDSFPNIEK
jgi:hypothetical protein